jgi:hypothetical protein
VWVYDEAPARPVALTLNPLGLFWGRLSANVEVLLAPHHAVIASPNVLVANATRSGTLGEGFGFAQRDSGSIGVELGYHYWWYWRRSLRGPFLGPSLLLGSTTNASVGNPAGAQAYWGVALDVGEQEVLPGGFTIGAGLGLGIVRMADSGAVFPRFLVQLGWSF